MKIRIGSLTVAGAVPEWPILKSSTGFPFNPPTPMTDGLLNTAVSLPPIWAQLKISWCQASFYNKGRDN
jgi:hypothetical protein